MFPRDFLLNRGQKSRSLRSYKCWRMPKPEKLWMFKNIMLPSFLTFFTSIVHVQCSVRLCNVMSINFLMPCHETGTLVSFIYCNRHQSIMRYTYVDRRLVIIINCIAVSWSISTWQCWESLIHTFCTSANIIEG